MLNSSDSMEQQAGTGTGLVHSSIGFLPNIDDQWALEFIDIHRIQPLIEALDDDVSGFVTITEVNSFTAARPLDWR
jgi:hypothetical protein